MEGQTRTTLPVETGMELGNARQTDHSMPPISLKMLQNYGITTAKTAVVEWSPDGKLPLPPVFKDTLAHAVRTNPGNIKNVSGGDVVGSSSYQPRVVKEDPVRFSVSAGLTAQRADEARLAFPCLEGDLGLKQRRPIASATTYLSMPPQHDQEQQLPTLKPTLSAGGFHQSGYAPVTELHAIPSLSSENENVHPRNPVSRDLHHPFERTQRDLVSMTV